MKPITKKLQNVDQYNFIHDTKKDVGTLMKYCNMLADKINELNDELQELKKGNDKNAMRKL